MDNVLILEMPIFKPIYKKWKKYGYKNIKEKNNLEAVLEESSEGYCMYCYSRIRVDGKLYANLEHAIEKGNSEKLIECVPNIGLTCSTCNQVFKRVGERKRKLPQELVEQFERESKCTVEKRKQCTVPCKALKKIRLQYNTSEEGHIILQPMGAVGSETGETLTLQYDVLNMEFQPANSTHTYTENEKNFINTHIRRFHLNDPKYKSKQLYTFIKNVIDNDGRMPEYEYNNWIVEEFRRKMQGKTQEEVLKICKSIFCIVFPKM